MTARTGGRHRPGARIALGLGLGAVAAAAWALEHRVVRRAARDVALGEPDLVLPGDLVHHDVDVPDGGRLHAMERGVGPPVVLVHGLMLSSAVWVHQLHDLGEHHRVVTVDLSGHGQSVLGARRFRTDEGPGPADALGRLSADLWAVLERLEVEGALLVGHSLGGMTVLRLALDTPPDALARRVRGLGLVSTTAGPVTALSPALARLGGDLSSRVVLAAERRGVHGLPSQDLRWWVSRLGFGADASGAQVEFVERMHSTNSARVFAELLPSLVAYDVSGRLGAVELPTLVVVGTHDRVIPPRQSLRLAGGLANAELVELARCGHQPMLERPHEFSRLLDEFSAKVR
ncbi:MAG TPA: alpha/beta hydrolase [Acidimicrobiales bacterium]|nr:alpha/beta hydrolase [Acidimicrobiales bacterium]